MSCPPMSPSILDRPSPHGKGSGAMPPKPLTLHVTVAIPELKELVSLLSKTTETIARLDMTNTDDERAAREWAEQVLNRDGVYSVSEYKRAKTMIRLLDRPALPRGEDVPDDGVVRMCHVAFPDGWETIDKDNIRAAVDVLHAHLTAPPPVKKVEVWAVVDATGQRVLCRKQSDAEYWRGIYHGSRVVKLVEAADE